MGGQFESLNTQTEEGLCYTATATTTTPATTTGTTATGGAKQVDGVHLPEVASA